MRPRRRRRNAALPARALRPRRPSKKPLPESLHPGKRPTPRAHRGPHRCLPHRSPRPGSVPRRRAGPIPTWWTTWRLPASEPPSVRAHRAPRRRRRRRNNRSQHTPPSGHAASALLVLTRRTCIVHSESALQRKQALVRHAARASAQCCRAVVRVIAASTVPCRPARMPVRVLRRRALPLAIAAASIRTIFHLVPDLLPLLAPTERPSALHADLFRQVLLLGSCHVETRFRGLDGWGSSMSWRRPGRRPCHSNLPLMSSGAAAHRAKVCSECL